MPLKSGNKTWTISDLIAIHEADLKRTKSNNCVVLDKLKEHENDWNIPDFEKWIFETQEIEGPAYAYLGIKNAHIYDEDPIASELQEYYAEALDQMPFKWSRHRVEQLLHDDKIPGGLSDKTTKLLYSIIDKHHPNKDEFLAQELAHPRKSKQ